MTAQQKYTGLVETIGHHFKDYKLLDEALTHPSLTKGRSGREQDPARDYDRLEFLGDRVLGLVVAEYLYGKFSKAEAGILSRRFNSLVRSETLAMIAAKINLGSYIQMSEDLAGNGGRDNRAILEDCMESLIAALYLDGGLGSARTFILQFWGDALTSLDGASRDAKSALQEFAAARNLTAPVYETVGRTGPDHAPVFTIAVSVGNSAPASGSASSKRAAEQIAAKTLLEELSGDN